MQVWHDVGELVRRLQEGTWFGFAEVDIEILWWSYYNKHWVLLDWVHTEVVKYHLEG